MTTRNTVIAFIEAQGHTPHYSGKKRTLYITGPNAEHVELELIKKFGYTLPFKTASQAVQQFNEKRINPYSKTGIAMAASAAAKAINDVKTVQNGKA